MKACRRQSFCQSLPPRGLYPGLGNDPPRFYCGDQRSIVPLCLIRVGDGKLGHGLGKRVVLADVSGDGRRIAGSGVGLGQAPGAEVDVRFEVGLVHQFDVRRALHILELTPVVVAIGLIVSVPAQEHVAAGLHEPLRHDNAFGR